MAGQFEDARLDTSENRRTHFRMQEPASLRAWEARAAGLRRQILAASGLMAMPGRGAVRTIPAGRREFADFAVENVLLETWPGFFLAGNLWLPAARGRRPAVLLPHGHWKGGRLENSEECSTPALGAGLARRGYVAFSYDMVGYGGTKQLPHEFGESEESLLWSWGPLGVQLWNSLRVFDWLRSRGDVDGARIGVTGASGGGTQTFLLSAVEPRIRASAPVNMVSYTMQGGCVCENPAGLRVGTNNVEIAALMAPRPMLLVSATRDWTKNTMREEYPDIQRVYRLYRRENRVEAVQFDAPHNYNRQSREAVYGFLERHLKGARSAARQIEAPLPFDSVEFLRPSKNAWPAAQISRDEFAKSWRRQAGGSREHLMAVCGAEWPAVVEQRAGGDAVVLSRPGRGDTVRCRFTGTGDRAVLTIGDSAQPTDETSLRLEPFRSRNESRPAGDRHFYTYHRSDDALRVQDILTALRFLEMRGAKRVRIAAKNAAAAWALMAAALSPLRVEMDLSVFPAEPDDEWYVENLMIPGVRRAGGINAARRLLARP